MFWSDSPLHAAALILAASGYEPPAFKMPEEKCRLDHLHERATTQVCPVCGYFRRCGSQLCAHCIMMEYERSRLAWLIRLAILAGEIDEDYHLYIDDYDELPEVLAGTTWEYEEEESEAPEAADKKAAD